jgi:spermidine/putrescine transport system ATP-binding protein
MYITHDQTIALAMSDTIAVINFGKLEQVASPEELYRRPATHFVASFVGENNQLNNGRVIKLVDDNTCQVDLEGIPMIARTGENLAVGDKIDLFIRPEMILLQPGKKESGIMGKIKEINFDGSHSLVVVNLTDSKTPTNVNVKLQHTEQTPDVATGDVVTLSWGRPAATAFLHIDAPSNGKE